MKWVEIKWFYIHSRIILMSFCVCALFLMFFHAVERTNNGASIMLDRKVLTVRFLADKTANKPIIKSSHRHRNAIWTSKCCFFSWNQRLLVQMYTMIYMNCLWTTQTFTSCIYILLTNSRWIFCRQSYLFSRKIRKNIIWSLNLCIKLISKELRGVLYIHFVNLFSL